MMAGLLAQPKGALRNAPAETPSFVIPKDLQESLLPPSWPGRNHYDMKDGAWFDQFLEPEFVGGGFDRPPEVLRALHSLIGQHDLSKYPVLRKMGLTDEDISELNWYFKGDYEDGWADTLKQWDMRGQDKNRRDKQKYNRNFGQGTIDPDIAITYTNRGRSP